MTLSIQEYREQLDVQDHTRLATSYLKVNQIVDNITSLNVFPPLVWVWAWDTIRYKLNNYGAPADDEYQTNTELSQEDVWWMFVRDADINGFTLEYGSEDLDEAITQWMIDSNILVYLPEDQEEEGDE